MFKKNYLSKNGKNSLHENVKTCSNHFKKFWLLFE